MLWCVFVFVEVSGQSSVKSRTVFLTLSLGIESKELFKLEIVAKRLGTNLTNGVFVHAIILTTLLCGGRELINKKSFLFQSTLRIK